MTDIAVTAQAGPRVLMVGATSCMAQAVARRYASRGARLTLLGRRLDALEAAAADLRVRGAAEVTVGAFDAETPEAHAAAIGQAWDRWNGLDVAIVAHGILPDQERAEQDSAYALQTFGVNACSVLAVLGELGNRFEAQRHGVIGAFASPAAERGRASNYIYGAAKAAVLVYCSGLRHRLFRSGVRVVTILPGFVDTPMTAGFRKGPLWARPERVAVDIERALDRANGEVHTPWFWAGIMLLVRSLPRALFLRTRL